MKKGKKFCRFGVAALLALSVAMPAAFANKGGHGFTGSHGKGTGLEEMFFHKAYLLLEKQEELGLSDEQAQAIRSLKLDVKKGLIQKKAEIEILKLEIRAKLGEDQVEVPAVQTLVDQKYDAKKAKAKTLVEAYAKLKSAVTEEQWKTFKDLKKKWMKERAA